jgi:hypothetical protein
MQPQPEVQAQGAHKAEQHIAVIVVTTSGAYPPERSDEVPIHQPVKVELDKAQKALHIADTTNWIVTVAGNTIDPTKSYADNGLKGSAKLDWGPKEGGGGKGVGPDA